jgi:hypothetical protein
MKRIFINITLLCTLAGLFSSCSKKIEESYNNPEKISEGSLGKLLTGMYLNKRIHPSYFDYYTFVMPTLANYSQLVATAPGNQMYFPNPSYLEGRWSDFYAGASSDGNPDYNYNGPGILSNYREMQTTFSQMPAEQQQRNQVFLKCAEVLVYDQAAQMVDLWGDIPFSQAGGLNTPDRFTKDAAFDDAKSLYTTIINDLKAINAFLDTATVASDVKSELTSADILLKGDLVAWQRYANSLRLRLLMRISNTDETTAKTEVTAMLNDAATFPLIAENAQNVLFRESPTAVRSDLVDVFTGYPYAPEYLINTVQEANGDPRLQVMWDADDQNGFKGFPWNGSVGDYDDQRRLYAVYDTATFTYNDNLPGVIMTAAEVSFMKAEAYERWSLGDAAAEYTNGIRKSIEFYYGINQSAIKRQGQNNFSRAPLASPAAADIDAFLAKPAIAYAGTTAEKLQKIYLQKWEHFFVLQAGQAWAELRRTGYPALNFPTVGNSNAPTPPKRLLYPNNEKLYNPIEYSKVAAKDTRDTKIFWDAQ